MNRTRLAFTLALSISAGLLVAGCPNTGDGAGASTGSTLAGSATTPSIGSSGSSSSSATSGTSGSTVPTSPTLSFTMITAVAVAASGASAASAASGASAASAGTDDAPPNFTLEFNATNTATNLNTVCQANGGGAAAPSGGNNDPGKACLCQFTWGQTNTSTSQVINRTVQTQPTSVTPYEVQCPGPNVYTDDDEIPDNTVIAITLIPDTTNGNTSGFSCNSVNFTKQPATATGDFRDVEGNSFQNVYHYSCYDNIQLNTTIQHAYQTATSNQATNTSISATVANAFSPGALANSAQSYYYDFYVLGIAPGSISSGNGQFTCPTVNVNGTPSFFPMDSEFAVALQLSANFPVTISGRTTLPSGASGASGGSGGPGNIIGYAALPNSDGTCPSFTDSSGVVRLTYRLRQFTALFPLRYNGTGDIFDTSQPNNTIYVLDRPVSKIGANPLAPLTRLGPKPCPFSFATAQFGQKCSTDATLTGWNIDGTQIAGNNKCPIYPPIPQNVTGTGQNLFAKPDGTLVIRPFKSFLPHYLENTTLQACAFESTTPVDPVLVLSHDSGIFPGGQPSDFYCAQYYPPAGSVIPSAGVLTANAPGACDLSDTAAAIKTDETYSCLKTYDPSITTPQGPAAGCCQICSGTNCTAEGGGITPPGRNAVFTPPQDLGKGAGNPAQAENEIPRAIPNTNTPSCFDPSEN